MKNGGRCWGFYINLPPLKNGKMGSKNTTLTVLAICCSNIYLCNGRRAKSLKEIYWNRPKVSLLSSLLSPATHQVGKRTKLQCNQSPNFLTFQEPRNRCSLCWNFRTIYGGLEPSRNRAVVPAPPVYVAWRNRFLGIDSWASSKFKNTVSGGSVRQLGMRYRPARLHRLAGSIPLNS